MKKSKKSKKFNNPLKTIKDTNTNRYRIITDNINYLGIFDNHQNIQLIKAPQDILYSQEYLEYSKEDIVKIAYICGQMNRAVTGL